MKTLKHLFMLGLFCMISIGASAEVYSGWCGDNAEWSFDTSTGLLSITGSGKMTDYDYSSDVPWYNYRNDITSLSIGDQITSIGNLAFYICSSLTSVTIPNSVTSIGQYAFDGCSGLTSVIIPNSVTVIGGSAFSGCSGLTSVTIPNSVTSIGSGAFWGCSGLTSVAIPNSVTSIGAGAFSGCSGLISMAVESGNKVYDSRGNCNAIIETASNTLISGCMNTTIPNSVTSIGSYAFEGCSGLTSVTIPESVTSIGDGAFYGCTSLPVENNIRYADTYLVEAVDRTLSTYTIKEGTKWIGEGAFSGCSGLTSVTIPESVTSIGDGAFYGCTSLPVENNIRYADTYLVEAVDRTLSTYTIKEGTKWIGSTAFNPCTSLTSIEIPNSVTSIGHHAFTGCFRLTSVTIPNSMIKIGEGAFQSCSSLTSVTIPNSVTSIGSSVFSDCSGLTSVKIGNSVTSIGAWAFAFCFRLKSITIPNSVTSIGDYAFISCLDLTSVYVEWKDTDKIPSLTSSVKFSYSTCDLYVPTGTKTIYQGKDYWSTFKNIYEYELESLLLGDANDDGSVNVNDITTIATYILDGEAAPWNEKNADANEDGSINVNDITATAAIILNPVNPGREELITNGNMESDDVRCFFTIEPSTGGPHPAVIVEGEGYDGSRCIKLVSADGASQDDWATEFFIKLLRPLAVGTKLHVEFDYKSDKEAASDTQCHSTPGNYLHWQCIGNPTWQPNWQHFSADITTDASMTDAFQTIAFNLAKNKVQTTFWIDNIVVYTEVNEGSSDQLLGEQIENGDLESGDVSCFFTTEPTTGGPHPSVIYDGVGVNGSRGIKVVSANGASQDDWATQFFIKVPKAIKVGTKIKVSFDYRASIESDADTQTHSTPGNYIHWTCIGSPHFTTNWQHYEYEGVTTSNMTDNFQTITFNLAKNKVQTEYYFDNISFVVEK